MRNNRNPDFASLLDDLSVASEPPASTASAPSIPFDCLSVVDELLSGRIQVAGAAMVAEYRDSGSDDAILDEPLQVVEPVKPELPLSVEPDEIAAELGLASASLSQLGRLRREFAWKNHPDRVSPHLRPRAPTPMQVANGLIDHATRRALAGVAR